MTSTTSPAGTPSTTSDDPRLAHLAALDALLAVIDGVTPEHHDLPTPDARMDVRRLLNHLVMVVSRSASAGRRDPAEQWAEETSYDDGHAQRARQLATTVLPAWSDDALAADVVDLPWGSMPPRIALGIYTSEYILHGWDLATATGQPFTADPFAVAEATAALHDQLPDQVRTMLAEMMGDDAPFAAAVAVPADAPALDRLIGFSGRDPRWTASAG